MTYLLMVHKEVDTFLFVWQKCQRANNHIIWQFIEIGTILHDQNMQWNYNSTWNIQLAEYFLHDI